MKRSRFTGSQIVSILKDADAGKKVKDICRRRRFYRVYKATKLNLPGRTRRRLPARVQQPMVVEARANAEWSMDFMSDTLHHGRRFRTLNILDEGVREALEIVVDTSIPGGRVVRTLDRLVEW